MQSVSYRSDGNDQIKLERRRVKESEKNVEDCSGVRRSERRGAQLEEQ